MVSLFLLTHSALLRLNRAATAASWSCNMVRTASTTLVGSGTQSGDLPSVSTTACCIGLSPDPCVSGTVVGTASGTFIVGQQ